jgi:hypothetical protein
MSPWSRNLCIQTGKCLRCYNTGYWIIWKIYIKESKFLHVHIIYRYVYIDMYVLYIHMTTWWIDSLTCRWNWSLGHRDKSLHLNTGWHWWGFRDRCLCQCHSSFQCIHPGRNTHIYQSSPHRSHHSDTDWKNTPVDGEIASCKTRDLGPVFIVSQSRSADVGPVYFRLLRS